MRKTLLIAALAAAAMAATALRVDAQVTTLYDATSGSKFGDDFFGPRPRLDDATFVTAGPGATITSIDFGYVNLSSDLENVEAVVTFFDNVNTTATGGTVVTDSELGTYTFPIGDVAGGTSGITGLRSLPTPLVVPDNNVGVAITFNITGSADQSSIAALLQDALPTVGSTADRYWSDDFNPDGQFEGNEAVIPQPGSTTSANFYLRLEGSPIPEPTAAVALISLGGMLALRRRREVC